MPSDCWRLASLTSSMSVRTSATPAVTPAKASVTPPTIAAAACARPVDVSINPAVSRAAAAARWASERTSSATTAKPIPASPARAASTAALSARMLVWNAISSTVLMMRATSRLDSTIAPIELTIWSSVSRARRARSSASRISEAALPAWSALRRVIAAICSSDAEVSSSEAACSVAPCDNVCAELATWVAAAVVCPAPSSSASITRSRGWTMLRVPMTVSPTSAAKTTARTMAVAQIWRDTACCSAVLRSLTTARSRSTSLSMRSVGARSWPFTAASAPAASVPPVAANWSSAVAYRAPIALCASRNVSSNCCASRSLTAARRSVACVRAAASSSVKPLRYFASCSGSAPRSRTFFHSCTCFLKVTCMTRAASWCWTSSSFSRRSYVALVLLSVKSSQPEPAAPATSTAPTSASSRADSFQLDIHVLPVRHGGTLPAYESHTQSAAGRGC